jgi:hypothetical protein
VKSAFLKEKHVLTKSGEGKLVARTDGFTLTTDGDIAGDPKWIYVLFVQPRSFERD